MRRDILVLILVIVAVAIAVIPMTFQEPGQNGKPIPGPGPAGKSFTTAVSNATHVAFRAAVPPVPDTMTVFRLVNGTTAEEAKSIMRSLGFSGTVGEADGTYYPVDDSDDFSVNRSSGVLYYNNNINGDRPIPEDRYELLPADDEAVRIARDFMIAKGIWPDDAVFQEVHLRLTEITSARNGTIVTGNGLKQVEFSRAINGTPVFGDFIRVDIGANGEVVRVFRTWRAVEPVGIVPIASMGNAYEELVGRGIFGEPGNISPGTVDLVQLGYAEENPGYLVPVYAFFGTRTVNNTTKGYSELVPAALVPG